MKPTNDWSRKAEKPNEAEKSNETEKPNEVSAFQRHLAFQRDQAFQRIRRFRVSAPHSPYGVLVCPFLRVGFCEQTIL